MPLPLLIIGIGNEYRSDDGVGLIVLRALKSAYVGDAHLVECSGDGAEVLALLGTATVVILIDAVSSGAEAGTMYRIDARMQPIPASLSLHSTHSFGVAEAIELARACNQLAPSLTVYAIEGKNFTPGLGLSQEVEHAVNTMVEQVRDDVVRRRTVRSA